MELKVASKNSQVFYSTAEPYKERSLDPQTLIKTYRNLNRNGKWYSMMQFNKVVAHSQNLVLHSCKFMVNQRGNQRVREEGQKNVHAFIRGYFVGAFIPDEELIQIDYDPYTMISFQTVDTGVEVFNATYVILNQDGVFVTGINQ